MTSSTLVLGQEFQQPLAHTILPVAVVNVQKFPAGATSLRIVGYFPISETEFDGTETSFTLASGDVQVSSVRYPQGLRRTIDNEGTERLNEYMVAVWPQSGVDAEPWRGHPEFIPFQNTGYFRRWSQPSSGAILNYGTGVLLGSIWQNMAIRSDAADPVVPPVVPGDDGTLRWVASMDIASTGHPCDFFDFNWWDTFQADPPPNLDLNTVVPLRISTVSNPDTGEFKAAVLQRQTIVPGGAPVFTDIRIIKMVDSPPAGDYTFEFRIFMNHEGVELSHDVELTLTVV